MPRTLIETAITTPAARARLTVGKHWRQLDTGVHLGYRKGRRTGLWFVRWRHAAGYRQAEIGPADDVIKEGALSFAQAEKLARDCVEEARKAEAAAAAGPPATVRSSVESYVAMRDLRDSRRKGRKVRSDASRRLGRYILEEAGRGGDVVPCSILDTGLHELREQDLEQWRDALPTALKPSTKLRLSNDFKAALNLVYLQNRSRLPANLPEVIRYGLRQREGDNETDQPARDNQILSDDQIAQVLEATREVDLANGWEGDLYRLVLVLASTGARFSQVARLKVRDLQMDAARFIIPCSFKGRGKSGSITVPVGQDVLTALHDAVAARGNDEFLLERWKRVQVRGSIRWERDRREKWESSSEFSRDWHLIRKRAGLVHIEPYALRHSSIVRGIRANLPVRLVAALHDTSVQMIEKHYSRWITDGLEELAARAIIPLVRSSTS